MQIKTNNNVITINLKNGTEIHIDSSMFEENGEELISITSKVGNDIVGDSDINIVTSEDKIITLDDIDFPNTHHLTRKK